MSEENEMSTFAAAFVQADEQKRNTGSQKRLKRVPIQKTSVPHSDPIREYRRKMSKLEAIRIEAHRLGQQWLESIEGDIVNPKLQRQVKQAFRPIRSKLTGGTLSDSEGASILMELMRGLEIHDNRLSIGQLNYLKGMEAKGWFQELRRNGRVTDSGKFSGVLYGIVALGDVMDLAPGERLSYQRHLHKVAVATGPRERLRIDNLTYGWLKTVGKPS